MFCTPLQPWLHLGPLRGPRALGAAWSQNCPMVESLHLRATHQGDMAIVCWWPRAGQVVGCHGVQTSWWPPPRCDLGVPKVGCPLWSLPCTSPGNGAGAPWGVPEQRQCPAGCLVLVPVLGGTSQSRTRCSCQDCHPTGTGCTSWGQPSPSPGGAERGPYIPPSTGHHVGAAVDLGGTIRGSSIRQEQNAGPRAAV